MLTLGPNGNFSVPQGREDVLTVDTEGDSEEREVVKDLTCYYPILNIPEPYCYTYICLGARDSDEQEHPEDEESGDDASMGKGVHE